jgi:hypothetical protein
VPPAAECALRAATCVWRHLTKRLYRRSLGASSSPLILTVISLLIIYMIDYRIAMGEKDRIRSVAIIGAGASGICTPRVFQPHNSTYAGQQAQWRQQPFRLRTITRKSGFSKEESLQEALGRSWWPYVAGLETDALQLHRIFDPTVQPRLDVKPGSLPISADPPLEIPDELPRVTTPNKQDRFAYTPIYESLT